jgi:hypothetical protein
MISDYTYCHPYAWCFLNSSSPQFYFILQNKVDKVRRKNSTYKGLKMMQTDTSFVLNMGLLSDALTELEELSLELQKHSISLIHPHTLLAIGNKTDIKYAYRIWRLQ